MEISQNFVALSEYMNFTTYQIPGPIGTHLYLQHLHKPSGRYVWQVVNYVGRIIIAILEFHHVHQEVAFQLQFKKKTNMNLFACIDKTSIKNPSVFLRRFQFFRDTME